MTWSASSGATSYQVERSSNGSAFAPVGSPTVASFTDSPVVSGTTYLYRVRAVGSGGTSGSSLADLATPFAFTVGTLFQIEHINELRQAVNAVRASAGLPAFAGWADPTPLRQQTTIKAAHINEVRSKLLEAYAQLRATWGGFPDPNFGPAVVAQQTVVSAAHFDAVRNATQ